MTSTTEEENRIIGKLASKKAAESVASFSHWCLFIPSKEYSGKLC